MELETGCFYWLRQIYEGIWRVCYISKDCDNEQWLCIIGSEPIKMSEMSLGWFDWEKISPPTLGDNQT